MSGLSPSANLLSPLTLQQAQQQLTSQFEAIATIAPNTDKGSAIQSLFNSVALLFAQGQVTQQGLLNVSRLATSFGADVDSFVGAFNYKRQLAVAATGTVTFSLNAPAASPIVIPIGTMVMASGGILYTVVIDESQVGYSATANGYVISTGQSSVNGTVQCTVAGVVGNVDAGQISAFYGGGGAVPPVSTISNAEDFDTGLDQESDSSLKARFTLGISGGGGGTANAIASAVLGVQENLTYSIGDMLNIQGTGSAPQTTTTAATAIPAVNASAAFPVANVNELPYLAFVLVYDGSQAFYGQVTAIGTSSITIKNIATLVNGSGTIANDASVLFAGGSGFFTVVANILGQAAGPPAQLLTSIAAAVDANRAAGISRSVIGPTLVDVNGAGTLVLEPGAVSSTVLTAAQSAYDAFINNIGLDPAGAETICPYIDVGMTLRQVPGVKRVDGLTLNSGTVDITAGFAAQLVAGTFTFTTSPGP